MYKNSIAYLSFHLTVKVQELPLHNDNTSDSSCWQYIMFFVYQILKFIFIKLQAHWTRKSASFRRRRTIVSNRKSDCFEVHLPQIFYKWQKVQFYKLSVTSQVFNLFTLNDTIIQKLPWQMPVGVRLYQVNISWFKVGIKKVNNIFYVIVIYRMTKNLLPFQ